MSTEQELTGAQQDTLRRLEEQARQIARNLDGALNAAGPGSTEPRRFGFALLLFEFGEPPTPATYISNGTREDMIKAIEEWLAQLRATP